MIREFRSISEVNGPLVFVEGVSDAAYGELVEFQLNGEIRHGHFAVEVRHDECRDDDDRKEEGDDGHLSRHEHALPERPVVVGDRLEAGRHRTCGEGGHR